MQTFENNNNSNDESYEIDSDKLEEIQEILDKHGFTVTVAELAQEISVLKKCHHVFLTICIAKSFSSFGKKCPVCKEPTSVSDLVRIASDQV